MRTLPEVAAGGGIREIPCSSVVKNLRCSPPSGTPSSSVLSAGYARPKGLAHPRLSIIQPLRGCDCRSSSGAVSDAHLSAGYARRAGDRKGRPYNEARTVVRTRMAAGTVARMPSGTVGATLVVARMAARRGQGGGEYPPGGRPRGSPLPARFVIDPRKRKVCRYFAVVNQKRKAHEKL